LVPTDAENVPRMNFYLTTENWNSMTKDKKAKNVKITFKDPNLGENKEWNGCDVSW
jgi:hypothetical protein